MNEDIDSSTGEAWMRAADTVRYGSLTAIHTREPLELTTSETLALLADVAAAAAEVADFAWAEHQRVQDQAAALENAVDGGPR